jgi:hypothetical protein
MVAGEIWIESLSPQSLCHQGGNRGERVLIYIQRENAKICHSNVSAICLINFVLIQMSSTKGGIRDHQFWEYCSFGRWFFTSHFVLIKTSIIPSFTKPLWLGNLGTKIKKKSIFCIFSGYFHGTKFLKCKLIFKEQIFMRETKKRMVFDFCIFFGRARVCWPHLCLCCPFCTFERCLDVIKSQIYFVRHSISVKLYYAVVTYTCTLLNYRKSWIFYEVGLFFKSQKGGGVWTNDYLQR